MNRLYKVFNRADCKELGLHYSPLERLVFSEYNSGHYTLTRYASTLGKICIILFLPIAIVWHIVRAIKECILATCAAIDTHDRENIWGEDNKYVCYLKNKY